MFTHSLCDKHPWIVTVWHHQLTARVPSMATSFHCGISTRVTRSPHGRCIQRRNIGSILNYLHLTDTAHLCSFVLRNQLRSRYGRHNLITTRYIFYCQSKHLNVLCATKFLYDNSPVLFMPVLNFFLTHEIHVVVVTFTAAKLLLVIQSYIKSISVFILLRKNRVNSYNYLLGVRTLSPWHMFIVFLRQVMHEASDSILIGQPNSQMQRNCGLLTPLVEDMFL